MKNIILYIIVLSGSLSLAAQDTLITERDTIITNTGKIEVDQVEVIKAFEAKLSDAKRISVKPVVPTVVPVEKTYNYEITIVPVPIEYPDPVIKPLAMNADQPKNVNNFYSRVGYGDLKSPYADISYQGVKGDELDYHISGHYYGADDSDDIAFREFSEADLTIGGGYRIGENNKIKVELNGQYDSRYLYDTLFSDIINLPEFERRVFQLGTKVSFGNIETTDIGIDYNTYLNAGTIDFTNGLGRETTIDLGFNLQKTLSSSFSLILDTEANLSTLSYNEVESRKSIVIKPGIAYNKGIINFKAKGDIFFDNEGSHPFIESELGASLMDNSLQVYIGVDQEIQNNTLANKFKENPFLNQLSVVNFINTISKQYYGGVRGKFRELLSFNFAAGYEDIENQSFYQSSRGVSNELIFDDMTNIFINANIEFKINEIFTVGGIVDQNFFSPETLEKAVNLPEYSYNAYTKISLLNDKLKIRGDIFLADRINFQEGLSDDFFRGNNQLDFSVGFDYYFTKNIGIWAKANNLFGREYLRYQNYPGIGRNFLGGVLVKF